MNTIHHNTATLKGIIAIAYLSRQSGL